MMPIIVLQNTAIGTFYELKSVLCDTNVNLRTRRKILESCVRSRLTYGTAAWFPNEQEMKKLEGCWNQCLRDMVKGGWKRRNVPGSDEEDEEADYAFIYTNEQIVNILKTTPLRNSIYSQYVPKTLHLQRYYCLQSHKEDTIMSPGGRSRSCLEYQVIKPRG